jgi:hypothetical protein
MQTSSDKRMCNVTSLVVSNSWNCVSRHLRDRSRPCRFQKRVCSLSDNNVKCDAHYFKIDGLWNDCACNVDRTDSWAAMRSLPCSEHNGVIFAGIESQTAVIEPGMKSTQTILKVRNVKWSVYWREAMSSWMSRACCCWLTEGRNVWSMRYLTAEKEKVKNWLSKKSDVNGTTENVNRPMRNAW